MPPFRGPLHECRRRDPSPGRARRAPFRSAANEALSYPTANAVET